MERMCCCAVTISARERATVSTASTLPESFFSGMAVAFTLSSRRVGQIKMALVCWPVLRAAVIGCWYFAAPATSPFATHKVFGSKAAGWLVGLRGIRGGRRGGAGIAIEEHLHSGRDGQIGQEALVEPPSADQPHGGLRAAHGAHREQSQGRAAVGEVFAFQKRLPGRLRRGRFRDSRNAPATARN